MMKVIMLTRGTGGDVYPFIRIGKLLQERGNEVLLLANQGFSNVIKNSGLAYASIDDFTSYQEWMKQRGEPESKESWQSYLKFKNLFMYEVVEKHCSSMSLLICHYALNVIAQLVSEKTGAIYVPVFPAPYYLYIHSSLVNMYTSSSGFLNETRRSIGLPSIQDWRTWLSEIGIGFWPKWFGEGGASGPLNVESVGFMLDESIDSGALPDYVEEVFGDSEPPILITHGTSSPSKNSFFDASLRACESLGRKAIVVTSDKHLLDARSSDLARIFDYLPFADLLPKVGAVIHHGGIGTCGRALASGVPQLVLPLGYDRPDNAVRLRRIGVGDYLPPSEWRPDSIEKSLCRLLSSKAVKDNCKGFSERLRTCDSVSLACDAIEYLTSAPPKYA
jgi:rhamnosyltransferase subunit B